MTDQIVIGAISNTFHLVKLLGLIIALGKKAIEQIRRGLCVVGEFLRFLIVLFQILRANSVLVIPGHAIRYPSAVPLFVSAGHYEELDFHLFKLANPENEILWRDLIAVRLADLSNAKRQFPIRGIEHVFEIHENALGGFGAYIR